MRWNDRGFSLVEVMITVAIVGVLAAIAVPKYQKSVSIQKANEAKGNLVSLVASEKTFWAEFNSVSARLDEVGWHPSGSQSYGYGFTGDFIGPNTLPVYKAADTACYDTVANDTTCAAGFTAKWQNAGSAKNNFSSPSFPVGAGWHAYARANLGGAADDEWKIDSLDNLVNTSNGM
jgi:prepilin-type N-terminal cleavage/methylation domain-containing protein